MKNIFYGLSNDLLKKLKKTTQPTFIKPMLATLTKNYFSSDEWVYEHKFDGERCLAFKKNGKVSLMSRNKKSIDVIYPEIKQALQKQNADNFIIDGEIVALKKGLSNFELLQERINLRNAQEVESKIKEIPVIYRIFDLLYVDGYDIQRLPIYARKMVLKKLLTYNKVLSYSEHKIGNGLALFKKACKLGWEGLIAKEINSSYVSKRSTNWLKFKCIVGQELVIGGYTEPAGSRKEFGALLLGYYKDRKLKYAGKVGTGFSYKTLEFVGKKLKKLETIKCPFSDYDESISKVHWVSPKLVGEFKFSEWTKAGKLRQGRYLGLRTDKSAKEVVKEVPKLNI